MNTVTASPRIAAGLACLIMVPGIIRLLPLLESPKTSLIFLLGISPWGFFLSRAFSGRVTKFNYAGWLWAATLHLPLVVLLSPPAILIFVLSFAGLFLEIRLVVSSESAQNAGGQVPHP